MFRAMSLITRVKVRSAGFLCVKKDLSGGGEGHVMINMASQAVSSGELAWGTSLINLSLQAQGQADRGAPLSFHIRKAAHNQTRPDTRGS